MTEVINVPTVVVAELQRMTKIQRGEFIMKQCKALACFMDRYTAKCKEVGEMQAKLDLAEANVEQGRAMIMSVMERWYEYDR